MSDLEHRDVTALARDVERRPASVAVQTRRAVARGAKNIKRDWRDAASGLAHAPLYPLAIGYDLVSEPGYAFASIGPDKDLAQGALGNLIEYGSAKNPPGNQGGQALDAEEPRFVAALEAIAAQDLL